MRNKIQKPKGFFSRAQTPKMVKRQQAAIIDYYVKKRDSSKKK